MIAAMDSHPSIPPAPMQPVPPADLGQSRGMPAICKAVGCRLSVKAWDADYPQSRGVPTSRKVVGGGRSRIDPQGADCLLSRGVPASRKAVGWPLPVKCAPYRVSCLKKATHPGTAGETLSNFFQKFLQIILLQKYFLMKKIRIISKKKI